MANGMGSLYVAASGLQSSQNALNTTANNLANVDTKGYVRQQVLFADMNYQTFDTTSSISYQQKGIGVTIADVVHTRDVFLDKYYRAESGRQAFYQKCSDVTNEVEDYFQELNGQTFQKALVGDSEEEENDGSFRAAIDELAKDPSSDIYQNLVVEKACLAVERAQALYAGLQEYQLNLNDQISDDIDAINKLGRTIRDLNHKIQTIEAGRLETAMTLRDERDNALDKLGALANISYKEDVDGVVTVKLEDVEFVDECNVYEIGKYTDKRTGFVTPYWPHLSRPDVKQYYYVMDYSADISSELNTDIGELKALVLARGDRYADYRDVEGVSANKYNNSTYDRIATGMSIMLSSEASVDQLMHEIMTNMNDALCPNTTKTVYADAAHTSILQMPNGKELKDVLVWDEENAAVGSDGEPHELFVRKDIDRYSKVIGFDEAGHQKTFYIYNEEDTTNIDSMYTITNVRVNADMMKNGSLMASHRGDDIAYDLGDALSNVFGSTDMILNPNDTSPCSPKTFYTKFIGSLGIDGNIYSTVASSLDNTVASVDNQRQIVLGVSSDEELVNMVKYQNAYNASSRFMNVVSEMLEYLVMQLG